jgi:hypothetical protein
MDSKIIFWMKFVAWSLEWRPLRGCVGWRVGAARRTDD